MNKKTQESSKNDTKKTSIKILGGNVQIIPDAQNSQITQNNNLPSINMTELLALIENVRNTIPPNITKDETKIISDSLAVIESETQSDSPKASFLRSSIAAIKTIKGSVEFSASVIALVQFVQTFLTK